MTHVAGMDGDIKRWREKLTRHSGTGTVPHATLGVLSLFFPLLFYFSPCFLSTPAWSNMAAAPDVGAIAPVHTGASPAHGRHRTQRAPLHVMHKHLHAHPQRSDSSSSCSRTQQERS